MTLTNVAEYWDGRPCNIKHSAEPLGSKKYFEEVSRRKYFVENHIPKFAEFSSWEGKEVLEIGCGIGTAMHSFVENGSIYTGIDLSKKSIEIAKKRVKIFKLENVKLYVANVENLENEIPVKKYDLIYSFGVLHHTPNETNSFINIKNFSKSGTKVKIMLYNRVSTKAIYLWIRHGWKVGFSLDKAVALQSEAEYGCPVTRTYSRKDVQKISDLVGFKVTNVSVDHIFPFSVKYYVRYIYKRKWYWRIVPISIFSLLEKKLGWHLLIEGEF
jgi:2-polyprenyl-3-methyl-5-hydroxy-6-metoxy-1,4-benzoquinol methylase